METIRLGVNNLRLHKLRSLLTALGIIFGVAAVICMLSISEGASADELRMIQLLGTQNIIVSSIKPQSNTDASQRNTSMLQYGIKYRDLKLIEETIPHVGSIVPLKEVASSVRRHERKMQARVLGTMPEFFQAVNASAQRGRLLTSLDNTDKKPICIIGDEVRRELFAYEDPVGQDVLVERMEGTTAYTVVGVLKPMQTAGAPRRGVEERNMNGEIYIPFDTATTLYGDMMMRYSSGSREFTETELSGLYVTVDEVENVIPVSEMVARVFSHNHENLDYDVRVPLRSLQLAERKKRNSQYLLGFIAGISLLVGGIGIMNIMLATVTERTREIGIRRALGAKRRHITTQFLIETTVLSTAGGLCGIALGYAGSSVITHMAQWGAAIIQPWAVAISFGLSVIVGIFFGMYPAMTAARLDPIEALRYE